jgi:cyclase
MGNTNPYKKSGMFEGASPIIFENAKRLRNTMTDAETVLWMHVKGIINGCKFRRQHPIGQFVADFYCHKAKLIIEVDGSIHNLPDVKKMDKEKEEYLEQNGYVILRFSNNEIKTSIETVPGKITQTLNTNICKHSPNIGD